MAANGLIAGCPNLTYSHPVTTFPSEPTATDVQLGVGGAAMLSRASKITGAIAAAIAMAGAGLAAREMASHEPGNPSEPVLFVGLSLVVIGAVLLGAMCLHISSDREGVYRLGYEAGRLDTIREMNGREPAVVTPLRPASGGAYALSERPRSAAGRRAHPSQPARGRAEHADSRA